VRERGNKRKENIFTYRNLWRVHCDLFFRIKFFYRIYLFIDDLLRHINWINISSHLHYTYACMQWVGSVLHGIRTADGHVWIQEFFKLCVKIHTDSSKLPINPEKQILVAAKCICMSSHSTLSSCWKWITK
jgi:hypothetical protein